MKSFCRKDSRNFRPSACRRLLLWVVFLFAAAAPTAVGHGLAAAQSQTLPLESLEARWGVKPLSIRLTGADHFLDFRYRVTDSPKAAAVLSRKEKAYLIHQASGKVFPVPVTKLGPLRATAVAPKENRAYVILFANTNKMIKEGDKVTVVIGDFRVEDLAVGSEIGSDSKLPEAKQQEWETTQQRLLKEYTTCTEDCGRSKDCLDKCRKAYDARLNRGYQELVRQKP